MAHITLSKYDAMDLMTKAGRGESFTEFGLELILNYMDDCTEGGYEFDPIEIDNTFTEYDLTEDKQLKSFLVDYGDYVDEEDYEDEDDYIEAIIDELESETCVLCKDVDTLIFRSDF